MAITLFCLLGYLFKVILVSLNAQGLRSSDRRELTFQFFNGKKFDIICLQETHWTSDLEIIVKRQWKADIYFPNRTANARGVPVLIQPRLHHIVKQIRSDNKGRIVNILLDIDDHILNIVNVYAPNNDSERGAFFTDLNRFLSSSLVILTVSSMQSLTSLEVIPIQHIQL